MVGAVILLTLVCIVLHSGNEHSIIVYIHWVFGLSENKSTFISQMDSKCVKVTQFDQ